MHSVINEWPFQDHLLSTYQPLQDHISLKKQPTWRALSKETWTAISRPSSEYNPIKQRALYQEIWMAISGCLPSATLPIWKALSRETWIAMSWKILCVQLHQLKRVLSLESLTAISRLPLKHNSTDSKRSVMGDWNNECAESVSKHHQWMAVCSWTNMTTMLYIHVTLHCYCSVHIEATLLHLQVKTKTTNWGIYLPYYWHICPINKYAHQIPNIYHTCKLVM